MKKTSVVIILSLSLFSCKKESDYNCQCTYTHVQDTKTTINVENFGMRFKSEDQAKINCKALNNRYATFNTTGDCILLLK